MNKIEEKNENGLFKINNRVIKADSILLGEKAVEYATELHKDLKHIECTTWFNMVCYHTSVCAESLVIDRETIHYRGAPIPTSMYRMTCSADDHSTEFWMSGHPFPLNDRGDRAREFIKWCKNICEVYQNDPYV